MDRGAVPVLSTRAANDVRQLHLLPFRQSGEDLLVQMPVLRPETCFQRLVEAVADSHLAEMAGQVKGLTEP